MKGVGDRPGLGGSGDIIEIERTITIGFSVPRSAPSRGGPVALGTQGLEIMQETPRGLCSDAICRE
jgi:hypothetical protein